MDESGRDGAEYSRKVENGRRVAGAIRSLINAKDLQLCMKDCLYVFKYGSETTLWKEKERSRIRVAQMNNLRGLLGNRRMDRFQYALIKGL